VAFALKFSDIPFGESYEEVENYQYSNEDESPVGQQNDRYLELPSPNYRRDEGTSFFRIEKRPAQVNFYLRMYYFRGQPSTQIILN
jgi:hypothetical protein